MKEIRNAVVARMQKRVKTKTRMARLAGNPDLARLWDYCELYGHDPYEVIALVFSDEYGEAVGLESQVKIAVDMVKLEHGSKVSIDADIKHTIAHESVSETEEWIGKMLGPKKVSASKKPRAH